MTDTLQSPASREVPFTKCPSPKQNLTSDQKHNAQKRNPPPRDRVGQRTKQVEADRRGGRESFAIQEDVRGWGYRAQLARTLGLSPTRSSCGVRNTAAVRVRVRNSLDVSTNVRVRNTLDERQGAEHSRRMRCDAGLGAPTLVSASPERKKARVACARRALVRIRT